MGSVHQTYHMVLLFFYSHLTAIFDAIKLPQFLVLLIFINSPIIVKLILFKKCHISWQSAHIILLSNSNYLIGMGRHIPTKHIYDHIFHI